MTDNTQVGLRKWCEAFIDGDISAGQFKRAVRIWHNKQVEAIIEATYNNLPSLDKLTVGNEMSDGYDQGVEAFRQAMIKALYGKED